MIEQRRRAIEKRCVLRGADEAKFCPCYFAACCPIGPPPGAYCWRCDNPVSVVTEGWECRQCYAFGSDATPTDNWNEAAEQRRPLVLPENAITA